MNTGEGHLSMRFLGLEVLQINFIECPVYHLDALSPNRHRVGPIISQWENPCSFWSKKDTVRLWPWLINCFVRAKTKSVFRFILASLCNSPHKQILKSLAIQVASLSQVTPRDNRCGAKTSRFVFPPISRYTLMCLSVLVGKMIDNDDDSSSLAVQPRMGMSVGGLGTSQTDKTDVHWNKMTAY